MRAAFCAPVFAPARLPVSCSASDKGGQPHSYSRRAALRGLAALALSLSASGVVGARRVRADVSSDDAALSNNPEGTLSVEHREDGTGGEHSEAAMEEEGEVHVEVGNGKTRGEIAQVLVARSGVVGFVAAFTMFGMAVSDRESGRVPLPEKYDPRLVARYFAIRPDRILARLCQFAIEGMRFAGLRARHAMEAPNDRFLSENVRIELEKERRAERAAAVREAATRLGPAAIKLGQAAATRPDIFGAELVRELQKLQDAVITPFPVEEAFALIRAEIGARPEVVFDKIEETPVAGASLGMVFRGEIDGNQVAVKVQRPRVAENIALDFYIVRRFVGVLQKVFGYKTELRQAIDEYASRMFEELDYRNEVENMVRFQEIYAGTKGVYIPKPYRIYSSKKVLVSEWIDGIKLIDEDSKVKADKLDVVETGIQFALTQLLDRGYLHADMHNGNMFSTPSGELAYIDFGLVSEIPLPVRESMVVALFYLVHGQYTALAETFESLGLMPPDEVEAQLPEIAAALEEVFENREVDPNSALYCDPVSPVVCKFSMIGVAEKLLQLGGRFPLVFSTYFVNNLRCLGMLEGLALNADPRFSVLNVLYPFIMRKILSGNAQSPYNQALQRVLMSSNGTLNWTQLDAMMREVKRSETEGVIHSSRRKIVKSKGESAEPLDELLLSSKGSFLRSQIMREWSLPPAGSGNGADDRPRPRDVFRRASMPGKARAIFRFLPALIFRAILRVYFAIFKTIVSAVRRRKPQSSRLLSSSD